jgi:uncharacterized protein (DUF58 family)
MESVPNRLPTAFIIPVVLLIVGFFLFMALLNGQRDLTALTLLIFAMVFGAKIWSRLSGAGILCDAFLNKRRMFPQETFTLSANVRNAKVLPVWIQMTVSCGQTIKSTESESASTKGSSLLWHQQLRLQWPLIALKRGVFRIGPPELKTGDLFGFYPRKKKLHSVLEVIVYPRLAPLKQFDVPRRDFFGIPGAKSPVEDPVYIYGIRDYQHGRPARSIHWKASARYHRLQEKICEPAGQEKILIVIDVERFSKYHAHDEFERCLEVVASTAVHFDRSGYGVGLATNGLIQGGGHPVLPVARNRRQLPKILEILARLQMKSSEAVTDIIRRGLKLPWGISCITFSYDSRPSTKDSSAYFKYRNIPVVSIVCRLSAVCKDDKRPHFARLLTLDDVCRKGSVENEG